MGVAYITPKWIHRLAQDLVEKLVMSQRIADWANWQKGGVAMGVACNKKARDF